MIICANWKMNLSLDQGLGLCSHLQDYVKENAKSFKPQSHKDNNLIIAPPLAYISLMKHLYPNLTFAAQNISSIKDEQGAYTGEVSAYMVSSMKVNYAMVGHYERRKFFHENDDITILKAFNCIKNSITPIVCFGELTMGQEPLESIKKLDNSLPTNVWYAYEPYWAIGNENLDFELIRNNLRKIIKYLEQKKQIKLLYGGSVNSQTVSEFSNIDGLDGLLVGSASLKADELIKIITHD